MSTDPSELETLRRERADLLQALMIRTAEVGALVSAFDNVFRALGIEPPAEVRTSMTALQASMRAELERLSQC